MADQTIHQGGASLEHTRENEEIEPTEMHLPSYADLNNVE